MSILKRAVSTLLVLYQEYPARANALILAAVVTVAGAAGIVVDQASVKHLIEVVIPILITGEATHHLVSPAR